jgi:metal-sulfur cluster biosynthetic enzyme
MSQDISLAEIKKTLNTIKHPAINSTLHDLGILKAVDLEGDKAIITLAFPYPNIPIKDLLINLVKTPLVNSGLTTEVKVTVMTPAELEKFLALEQQNWRS